jgi:glycosyltransferase involved in cell wall biosynthesis
MLEDTLQKAIGRLRAYPGSRAGCATNPAKPKLGEAASEPGRARPAKLRSVHHFGPDTRDTGGMETVVRTLAAETIGCDRATAHPTRSSRGHVTTLLMAFRAVLTLITLDREDIVHIHLSENGSFIREGTLALLARSRHLALVVTNHGATFETFAATHPRLVGAVLSSADVCLSLSDSTRRVSQMLAPNAVCARVVNPVPEDRSSPPADTTDEIVLFAGEVGTRKGVDVLLRAWEDVSLHRTAARLLIAGPSTSFVVSASATVEVLGALPTQRVRELIRSARLVVLPSRDEALPMILTEALAAGRPFVSSRVGGIPDLAHDVQALVEVEDPASLAHEMLVLLADPKLARSRGEAGRRFHARTRSIEAVDAVMRVHYEAAATHRRDNVRRHALPRWRAT